MPKSHSPDFSGREDGVDVEENQPLRTLSHGDPYEDAEDFATSHGLGDRLGLFQKASLLLRHQGDWNHITDISPEELDTLHRETTYKWRQPKLLYFTIFVCSLGAIEQGWAQTGMNGANLYLPTAFHIDSYSAHDSFVLGLINCGLYLAQGLIGSWLAEPVNNSVGRRGAIFLAAALCLVGNIGSAISWSWPTLFFFRLILGTGLGLSASTISVFAAESAPAYIRGGLAVSWQMFTAFGIFLGFLANLALVLYYDLHPRLIWRLQLAAPLVPTVPLLLTIYACPESPAWEIKRHRYDLAFGSLLSLRNTSLQAATELYFTYLSRRKNKLSQNQSTFLTKLKSLLTAPRNRHALYASYTVMLSQQLCGINIIAFFSSTIFLTSGFSALSAHCASVVFGLVNFLGAFPAVWTMDLFGRRRLLLWTLPWMAITMAAAGLSFGIHGVRAKLAVLTGCIYLFCALYSPGMGPVPCAYSAEVYPLPVREVGMSFAISTASLWATLLSLTFPILLEWLGEPSTFWLYAWLNVLAWVLCWLFVRETKGIELEEMDEVFESSPLRFVQESSRVVTGLFRRRKGLGKGWVEVAQEEDHPDVQ